MEEADTTQTATIAGRGSVVASLEAIIAAILETEVADLSLAIGTDFVLEGSHSLYFNHAF